MFDFLEKTGPETIVLYCIILAILAFLIFSSFIIVPKGKVYLIERAKEKKDLKVYHSGLRFKAALFDKVVAKMDQVFQEAFTIQDVQFADKSKLKIEVQIQIELVEPAKYYFQLQEKKNFEKIVRPIFVANLKKTSPEAYEEKFAKLETKAMAEIKEQEEDFGVNILGCSFTLGNKSES